MCDFIAIDIRECSGVGPFRGGVFMRGPLGRGRMVIFPYD
jgi:hypothetical protein